MKLFKLTLPAIDHTVVTEDGETLTLRNRTTNAVYAESTNREVLDLLASGHFYRRAALHCGSHKAFYNKAKSIEAQQPKLVSA